MEMLSLMLGGSHAVWTQIALLLGFFWVAIAKPERIAKVARFRTACILLGIAMIAPTAISLGLYSTSNPFASMVVGKSEPGNGIYLQIITPALQMTSFLLAMDSIAPGSEGSSPKAEN